MKLPIVAAALLVLAVPSFASDISPAQWRSIHAFEAENENCFYGSGDVKKSCTAADKLREKLTAQGFCVYGHGTVGRAGGRINKYRNHCYTIQ